MAGKIITFREVIELNQILVEKGLNIKVHLHDTCGRQSCSIDKDELLPKESYEMIKETIYEYFLSKAIQTSFINEELEFILN